MRDGFFDGYKPKNSCSYDGYKYLKRWWKMGYLSVKFRNVVEIAFSQFYTYFLMETKLKVSFKKWWKELLEIFFGKRKNYV